MHIANFSMINPEQTKHIKPINPISVKHAIHYKNSLLKTSENDRSQWNLLVPDPTKLGQWKGTHTNSDTYSRWITQVTKRKQLNPQDDMNCRNLFLSRFRWCSIRQRQTFSGNCIVTQPTTASRWLINNPLNISRLTLLTEHSHTKDWQKGLVVPYQHFQASFVNTSVRSSKAINVHNLLLILE